MHERELNGIFEAIKGWDGDLNDAVDPAKNVVDSEPCDLSTCGDEVDCEFEGMPGKCVAEDGGFFARLHKSLGKIN